MGYWTTALGKRRKFDKIGHQHLSNILWFKEVFNKATYSNDGAYRELLKELDYRFGGVRKPWKPLPIPTEIETLKAMGLIINNDIVFQGKKIGSIKHIK
jgi:hypothetical protein